jgi:inhibitor of cysteine peptidase
MRGVFILLAVLGLPALALAQASASARGRAAAGEPAEVSIGVFAFSLGEKVALELVRDEPCVCMCGDLTIESFRVLDGKGVEVFLDTGRPYPVTASEWVGRWGLRDASGVPVAPGTYIAVVKSSVGTFRAELEVLPAGDAPLGRSIARASVCGISLRVYRLLEKGDDGATVSLRRGERLMIALPGNPTTGYVWKPVDEPDFLVRLEGVEYVTATALIGGGGTFYFRYEAESPGIGALSFAYLRPWKEKPAETFSITVRVH